MTHEERDAFVEAFARNVATVHPTTVRKFVDSWCDGDDMYHSNDYTTIMDALLMWHEAIKFMAQKELTA